MLEIKDAQLGYMEKPDPKVVIKGLSFSLEKGEVLCVLGANGCGKTTLFRTILGFEPLLAGQILLDGLPLSAVGREQLARAVAYVPQYHTPPFPYSVYDVVLMGRSAHISGFSMPGKKDEECVLRALDRLGILHLKDKVYTKLSGGERQMVLIARALAQASSYILMDEPAANLDYGNQLKLLKVIGQLAGEGIGICFTTHNPDHAFLTDAAVLAVRDREHYDFGPARDVVTEGLLAAIYGIRGKITAYTGADGTLYRQVSAEL